MGSACNCLITGRDDKGNKLGLKESTRSIKCLRAFLKLPKGIEDKGRDIRQESPNDDRWERDAIKHCCLQGSKILPIQPGSHDEEGSAYCGKVPP